MVDVHVLGAPDVIAWGAGGFAAGAPSREVRNPLRVPWFIDRHMRPELNAPRARRVLPKALGLDI
jgi:hypothetical protein